jgi:hypothetical protein
MGAEAMTDTGWILIIACWYGLGVWGFVYWWRKDYDFTTCQLWIAALAGVIGPLSWLVGFSIHGDASVVLRKRTKP